MTKQCTIYLLVGKNNFKTSQIWEKEFLPDAKADKYLLYFDHLSILQADKDLSRVIKF